MVQRAFDNRKTEWTKFFYACRTALRTQAGQGVADFLLPVLVLDCLCFGNGQDRAMLLAEMRDVLFVDDKGAVLNESITLTDRRHAVSTIFSVIDHLQHWIEPEADVRYSKRSRSPGKDPGELIPLKSSLDSDWQYDESAMRIEDMMNELTLYLRGKAAFNVGMHAYALRCLEMASRLTVAGTIFGGEVNVVSFRKQSRSRAAGCCPEEAVSLLKDVLASLNDYETIAALVDDDVWAVPKTRTSDSIRQKEALQDWQGALHGYERAQQLNSCDPTLRIGILRCLLELGHFDSVLQQVHYIKMRKNEECSLDFADAVPLAVEASWRLGRWEALSELVETEIVDLVEPDALYQVYLGKALLNLQRKNLDGALSSLTHARTAVMDGLGNVARESYSRSYGHVVRLQAIREIEDVSQLLCYGESSSFGQLTNDSSLGWNRRLELLSSSGATSIINTRLVLARLSNDKAFEGSLFLRIGKRARKSGLLGAAGNAFAQAESAFRCVEDNQKAKLKSSLQLQFAKLKYDSGESSIALRMLGQEDIEAMGVLKKDELVEKSCTRVLHNLGIVQHGMRENEVLNIFVRSALQSTRWMIDGGLKEGAEIVARFRIIHCLAPIFEKGMVNSQHYCI
jgi:serine/threonine-protein kinase ATR